MTEHEPNLQTWSISKIAELRLGHGPIDKIVEQLFADCYHSPVLDQEKIYLGLKTLLEREGEGQAALQWLARDTGPLGATAQRLLAQLTWSDADLEKLCGIKRFGNVVDFEDFIQKPEQLASKLLVFGQKHGLIATGVTPEMLLEQLIGEMQMVKQHKFYDEQTLASLLATFGSFEPVYFELLGPDGVTKLRQIEKPNLVLLRSAGIPSARAFDRFVNKINPTAQRRVIDDDPELVTALKKYYPAALIQCDTGDVLHLRYPADSVDQFYTNMLLRELNIAGAIGATTEAVRTLLQGLKQTLKPGGQAVLAECPYGKFQGGPLQTGDVSGAMRELKSVARQVGFEIKNATTTSLRFFFRAQESSAKVSPNGLAFYSSSLLMQRSDAHMNLCLQKPS